ncbi:Two component system, signal transduction response regulator [Acididesulfobacillus acetoxydans]|uniref:Stage 0 sporulation protein A homolog n=1 Tax=Acididesulfobacillus acetoxydans TaxID=1561005 RepID=A0A8S0X633_9FIRM|nr:response regulator transcription factor [Acididesulfobacillus acetoxydans]CAA7602170.1 Two component system, signal transduction response regulator [Acididesulfobacillus acetoxydans]CEJ08726.1 Transcriptional regulatory protein YycF [Acididesulfobacillus acetoxydans]
MREFKPRILVVEDEEPIRRFITLNLNAAGFTVSEAGSGEEALRLLDSFQPKVVVLDLMLPGIGGLEVCQKIREAFSDIFVLVLTAKGLDTDKILGLELGADDYMVKPFNPLELIARIKAILRRTAGAKEGGDILVCGNIRLNIPANKVFKEDLEIDLTPIEFSLLRVFMENPGKALKREEMLNSVWGEDYFGDTKTLDVHIRRLREKIEDNPSRPCRIKTVWGSGYRWQQEL